MDEIQQLKQDVYRLQRQVAAVGSSSDSQPPQLASPLPSLQPIPPTVSPSAVNQIRNGELGHSVDTWNNPPPGSPAADVGKECAFFFSHDAPVTGQALDVVTTALTNPVNKTLKAYSPAHSNYDPNYCDWNRAKGEARLQGDKTLDAPFPSNRLVAPNRSIEFIGLMTARRNSTIVCQTDNHLFAGIWDVAVKDWILATNSFALSAAVRGVPAGTTERRYRVFASTDRGYTFLSDEVVVAAAPNDASFGSGVDVALTWTRIAGILEYWVYRHDITAGKYRLLIKIGSGNNNYGDNGNVLAGHADEGAYPVADRDRAFAYVATPTGGLSSVPIDGLSRWSPVFFNIPVPSDYDQGPTTAEQVLRLGMTKALDRQMVDAIAVNGNTSVESATGEFTARDTGRTATLTKGTDIHGPEAITFVDATHVTFVTAPAFDAVDASLYIEEGGDHGLLIDAIHASYVSGSAFAPYPDDTNRLQHGGQDPIAAPNHSSQGGAGGGGGGDPGDGGLGGCIEISTPVTTLFGNAYRSLPFFAVRRGQMLRSGNHTPNAVNDVLLSDCADLHILRTANGLELPCSPGQVVFRSMIDLHGISVERLQIGDFILTCFDGQDECSPVIEIQSTGMPAKTGTFSLWPGNRYLAGRLVLPWWKRIVRWLQGKHGVCAIYLHNAKQI